MAKKGKKNGKAEAAEAPPEGVVEQPPADNGSEPADAAVSTVADRHFSKKGKLKEEYYEAEMPVSYTHLTLPTSDLV